MLVMMKRREQRRKPVISLTGTLARALRPGMPAVYLYQGFLIRTSAVEWEAKLRKIEKKEYAAADFIKELKEMVWNITWRVRNDIGANKLH